MCMHIRYKEEFNNVRGKERVRVLEEYLARITGEDFSIADRGDNQYHLVFSDHGGKSVGNFEFNLTKKRWIPVSVGDMRFPHAFEILDVLDFLDHL